MKKNNNPNKIVKRNKINLKEMKIWVYKDNKLRSLKIDSLKKNFDLDQDPFLLKK
jgi:hypothetical protein